MSAGHAHKRASKATIPKLKALLDEPTAAEMLNRHVKIDFDHEIPDTGGWNVSGDTRFIDAQFAQWVRAGKVKVDGMTPEQILTAIFIHEKVEKALMDANNNIDLYEDAHEFATLAEHEFVRSLGCSCAAYEHGIEPAIKYNEKKPVTNPPLDLGCAPYLEEEDATDKKILKALRKLGVVDASKAPKSNVDYGKSSGEDQCFRCQFWQGDRAQDMSPCAKIAGLVRNNRWCKLYKEAEDGQEVDQQGDQTSGAVAPGPGGTTGGENPGQETGGSEPLQEPENPPAGGPGENA